MSEEQKDSLLETDIPETGETDDFYFDEVDTNEPDSFEPGENEPENFLKIPESFFDEPDDFNEEPDDSTDEADDFLDEADDPYEEPDEAFMEYDEDEEEEDEDDGDERSRSIMDYIAAVKGPKEKAPRKPWQTGILVACFVAVVVLVSLAGVYIGIADDYKTRYLPGTTINGVDVSEGTPADFEDYIRVGAEVYSIDLTFRDSTETIDGTQFDYHYVSSGEAQKILEEQNIFDWGLTKFGKTYEYKISWSTDYDRELLRNVVASLPELQPENETAPQNAYLNLNEDLTFSIVPEVQGNFVFNEPVINTVLDAVEDRQASVDFTAMSGIYDAPVVYADNPDLNWELENLNGFLSTSVTYTLSNGETRTLDRDDLVSWITRDDNGYYHVEESVVREKTKAFVAEMAAAVYAEYDEVPFNSTNHGTIWFDNAGTYAVILDEATESEALFNNIWNHESSERAPVYIRNDTEKGFDMGGSYVEVDVSMQHVYMYQNHELVFDAPCVSGTFYHAGYRTPIGIHKLNGKMEDATLYGPKKKDGTYEYIAEVEYWMPFTGSCGFHDAQWRTEDQFGSGQYLYDGSHGCINLSLDKARELYEKIYVGIPVVVHYRTD